jgi:hypothetical protein
MWTVGLLAGGLLPLGVLAALLELFVYCWFTAALGVWISSRARNSSRALFATIFWMLVLNAGYLALIPATGVLESDHLAVGMMPYMLWLSLVSFPEVFEIYSGQALATGDIGMIHVKEVPWACLASLLLYGMGALLLTRRAVKRFEKLADRPRRSPVRGGRGLGRRSTVPGTLNVAGVLRGPS